VNDLDGLVARIAAQGIHAERRETYRDSGGNEVGFGSIPS
jgi:hypothetical protein